MGVNIQMKKIVRSILLLPILFLCSCSLQNTNDTQSSNNDISQVTGESLVVSFSCTQNTESVGDMIAEKLDSEHFIIEPKIPYISEDLDYTNPNSRASVEQNNEKSRPEISNEISDFETYSNIFIGYPIWFGIAPRIIQTFLESYNFTAKDIYIFSTSASSSGQTAFNYLKNSYSEINFIDNIHFTSSSLSSSDSELDDWLAKNNIISEVYRISLTINNTTVDAKIYNNSVGRDLINRLPLTLDFSDYNSTEKIAYLPENSKEWDLSDCPTSCTPKIGDITMYSPWRNLAIFYKNFRKSNGLVPIGKMSDEAIDLIKSQDNNFKAMITINN